MEKPDRDFSNKEEWKWEYSEYGLNLLLKDYVSLRKRQYTLASHIAKTETRTIFYFLLMSCNPCNTKIYEILEHARNYCKDMGDI